MSTAPNIEGLRVRVYYNSQRTGFSVQDASTRLVVARVKSIELSDATFVVQEAGRQKVLATKTRNVHAFVVGTVADVVPDSFPRAAVKGWTRVRYNPYEAATFVEADTGTPVSSAARVRLALDGVYAMEVL